LNDRPRYRYWLGLAIVFAYISMDEACRIHELLTGVMRRLFGLGASGGLLYLSWVVPVGIVMLILGLLYARFICQLPFEVRRLAIFSAVVFIGGALGCELLESLVLRGP
jgi:hypothetical protein